MGEADNSAFGVTGATGATEPTGPSGVASATVDEGELVIDCATSSCVKGTIIASFASCPTGTLTGDAALH